MRWNSSQADDRVQAFASIGKRLQLRPSKPAKVLPIFKRDKPLTNLFGENAPKLYFSTEPWLIGECVADKPRNLAGEISHNLFFDCVLLANCGMQIRATDQGEPINAGALYQTGY